MYYIEKGARAIGVLILLAASWWSIKLARADQAFRKQTLEDAGGAVELAPLNSGYLITDALQTEYAGGDPAPLLERAARLNPRSSAPRIRLGLAAEIAGDTSGAERWLLEAANVDRQFETRWALANFYFRQERADDFWKWIRSALEVSYGDRRPAFDLCMRMTATPTGVLERALPERHEIVAAYLSYLLDRRSVGFAPVAMKLAANHTPGDLPVLYAADDALIFTGDFQAAENLWQALGYPKPSGVSNPDFANSPVSHGFDWRIVERQGVTHTSLDPPPGQRIRLSGRQPESAELLRQVITGLQSGTLYTLHWEARTQGFPTRSGLEWRIAGVSGAVVASDNWSGGDVAFAADSDHAVLVLAYRRPEGEARAEGFVDLRHVALIP